MTAAPGSAAAYHLDGARVSRQAFYAVACDPRRSVVVEACAGAGKTWMLVSRIVRALLDGAEPHEILAITFTRKAAGEMRDRLSEWLAAFASPSTPDDALADALRQRGVGASAAMQAVPALRGLYARVLAAGRPVEIRTFHAWFSQLLRAAPLDLLEGLGLQPEMALIEDEAEHEPAVFRRFHAAVLADAALHADYRQLVERRGRHGAEEWLKAAWDKRVELALADTAGVLASSIVPAAAPGPDGRVPHPTEAWQDAGRRASLGALAVRLRGHKTKTARDAGDKLDAALAAHGDTAQAAKALFDDVWAALFTTAGTPRKLAEVAGLADAHDDLAVTAQLIAQHDAWTEHATMVRLARVLLTEYAAHKRLRGLADMADLERCAFALLGDPVLSGWVQQRLDARVRHLLIDEFQDTSPLQWQALRGWLEGYVGAGGGTSGQRPLAVFIVGDPKQSIYRFRRAEPRVFAAAREFVAEALDGAVLACDHTRRNTPGVLDALNPVFAAAALADEFADFRPHTTEVEAAVPVALRALPGVARPARDAAAAPDDGNWRDSLRTPRHAPEEALRRQEAERVADAIAGGVAAGRWRPGDVFVLCRRRAPLHFAAEALQARRLPCAAVEAQSLMDAPEVRDLVAVMDVLVSPRHRLALAQALKSPLFGASDVDLLRLVARAGAEGDWWQALMDEGADGESGRVAPAGIGLPESWSDAADAVEGANRDETPDEQGWPSFKDVVATAAWGHGDDDGATARPHPGGLHRAGEATAHIDVATTDTPADTEPPLRRAARLLAAWRDAAGRLPPHDVLDRVVHESDALARIAAAAPPERRSVAVAAVEALLAQALLLDGGRYATPYGFVRALRQRAVKALAPAQPDAVQLLTVHGAKGLEARVVFVMDADPEAPQAERLSLLVDWPPDSAHPACCAFIASEKTCPPSLAGLLAREHAARRREGLNGLYVALTRARELIVVSHTAPYRKPPEPSWHDRLAPHARPWGNGDDLPPPADGSAVAASVESDAGSSSFTLPVLPTWRAAPDDALWREEGFDLDDAVGDDAAAAEAAARLGRAVCRVLDWATACGAAAADVTSTLPALARGAAAETGAVAADVLDRACRLLNADAACARFFLDGGGGGLRWGGNGLHLADRGGPLAIDRLVQLEGTAGEAPTWWVLGYDLLRSGRARPSVAARAHLLRRRAAVRRLQGDEPVRCAFVECDGGVTEVSADG